MPQGPALLLLMMRYPQELVDVATYDLPESDLDSYRVSKKELEFSRQLIETMSTSWQPDDYVDEFRHRLQEIIQKRIKEDGVVPADAPDIPDHAATNVVDFMELLKKSIAEKGKKKDDKMPASDKPARKSAATKAAKKTGAAKSDGKPSKKRKTG